MALDIAAVRNIAQKSGLPADHAVSVAEAAYMAHKHACEEERAYQAIKAIAAMLPPGQPLISA